MLKSCIHSLQSVSTIMLMRIRFIKPELKDCGDPEDGKNGITEKTVENCSHYIEELFAYLRGVVISIVVCTAFTLFIAFLYKWYLLFIGLPLVLYCIRSYNRTRFELKIHLFMHQISRELLIEKLTGRQGELSKRIFG